jgi:WD40 repeat protein
MTVIEVAIDPGVVPGMFRVKVVASGAGEVSATVELDAAALAARHGQLQQTVLASAVSSRRVLPATEHVVREVGQMLFDMLLGTGAVAGQYRAAAALAAERGERLRVVLRIDTPTLAGLPWESMYDQANDVYMCRQDHLVRHVPVAGVPAPLQIRLPLRILGVVSSPRRLPLLDVDKEQEQLTGALAGLASQGLAEVHWAPSATWAGLQEQLMDRDWHVVHFIGHGDYDPVRDEGMLMLMREDGQPHPVTAHRLVDLLHRAHPMPRLVVLNSCSGAETGASDLFSGTAAALVRGGVSAVAAMQYEISDSAAVAFARGFYTAIARGRGVDDAVSSGRTAIVGLSEHTLEWVTPVLYLRGHDTRLFRLPVRAKSTVRERDIGSRGQPGDTSSTGTESRNPPEDSPVNRTRPSVVARRRPGHPLGATSPSRLIGYLGDHTDAVIGVAFGLAGTVLATVGLDKTVLWDVATGEQMYPLTHRPGTVTGVAFSPDGTRLATASRDNVGRLWDVAAGTNVLAFVGHAKPLSGVAFSPDGTRVATNSDDKTTRLWNTATGEQTLCLRGYTRRVKQIAFSPDGTLLAVNSDDRTTWLWDVATGTKKGHLPGYTRRMNGMAFSPDGTRLAVTCNDKTTWLWDMVREKPRQLKSYDRRTNGVAFSPDGSLLATASDDETTWLWNVVASTPEVVDHLRGHDGAVNGVAFSPDGTRLATVGNDHTVRLWACPRT